MVQTPAPLLAIVFLLVLLSSIGVVDARIRKGKRGFIEGEQTTEMCDDFAWIQSQNSIPYNATQQGVTWAYNYGISTVFQKSQCPVFWDSGYSEKNHTPFVPMIWGSGTLAIPMDLPPFADALIGFNLPNIRDQANLSPLQAASLWPLMESIAENYSIPLLGAPTLTHCGFSNSKSPCWKTSDTWLREFFTECSKLYGKRRNNSYYPATGHCRIDFLPVHYFGCHLNNDPDYGIGLDDYINRIAALGTEKPIWVTGFSCGEVHNNNITKQMDWMKESVAYFESSPNVERYAWFEARGDHKHNLIQGNGTARKLTQLGELYLSLPSAP